ncbi:MAG: hypothetical protein VB064_03015 [Oscillospiraceae bacterium]|nr:hypothetical protein [Oscillospiraceae bacterium]
MNWSVSKGLFKSTLHGTTPAMGLSIYHKGRSYFIVDDSRKTVFTVTAQSDYQYIIEGDGGKSGKAELLLAGKAPVFLPPRAAWFNVELGNSRYKLKQCENRDFIVCSEDEEIGLLTNMLQIKPRFSLPDNVGAVLAALLYTLALIMLHEDDAEVL